MDGVRFGVRFMKDDVLKDILGIKKIKSPRVFVYLLFFGLVWFGCLRQALSA